ncbi:MAG TPA: lycopene beta-cyclase CrtY [Myxococcales bacterium]|nr:lycopene beta-cyclase CrtY [Myxococcales bacterium]
MEFVIVGGGLSGSLLALALRGRDIVLLESGQSLGGNHLWSFHEGDLQGEARALVEPLIVARWPAYEVAFPGHQRRVESGYFSVSSDRLHQVVTAALGDRVRFSARAVRLWNGAVELEDGHVLRGRVLDCRGPGQLQGKFAWQKFCGVEVRTSRAPTLPMLMDARVPQVDGFRFLYTLPLAADRVLVEDTRFSGDPHLDIKAVHASALTAARAAGHDGEVLRSEHGVLPLPIDRMPDGQGLGYGGGYFHPVTGYSLPLAAKVAVSVARGEPLPHWRGAQRFGLLLNRLLYRATQPEDRFRVLSRFYQLPEPVLRRFYALESTHLDRARILCGRPPRGVSLLRALGALT